MNYLVNSFAPNMLPLGRHIIEFNLIKPQNAALKVIKLLAKKEIVNCIGHSMSNNLIKKELIKYQPELEELWISGKRLTVKINPHTDSLIVASYRGKRLREGTKDLPEDAQIVYWRVNFMHKRTLNAI